MSTYPIFYLSRHSQKIEEMQAVKHTDKTVWIKGRWRASPERLEKSAMVCSWGRYFLTRELAVAALRARFEAQIKRAEETIAESRAALAKLT